MHKSVVWLSVIVLAMHDCCMEGTPICNRSIESFVTAAVCLLNVKFQALQVTSSGSTAKILPSKCIFKLHPPKINPSKKFCAIGIYSIVEPRAHGSIVCELHALFRVEHYIESHVSNNFSLKRDHYYMLILENFSAKKFG